MLRNNQGTETKIAVLEERLMSYENMMKKIEEVIQVMSETSQSVSKMLAVHEERIEYTSKNDQIILDKIKLIEERSLEDNRQLSDKIENIEEKISRELKNIESRIEEKIGEELKNIEVRIEDISRIKWITVGTGLVLTILIGAISSLASGFLSPPTPAPEKLPSQTLTAR